MSHLASPTLSFLKITTLLGKSIQSIIQLQSDSTDSILSFQCIYIRLVLMIRLYNIPHTIRIYIHSINIIFLQFKMTVWSFHSLLIAICCPTFATLIPYNIQYLLQSYNLSICIPLVGKTIQYIDQLQYTLSFRKISP